MDAIRMMLAKETRAEIFWDLIDAGTPVEFENAETDEISVSRLTNNTAIVCYEDHGNSNSCTACALAVNGSTITAGSAVAVVSNSSSISVVGLSEITAMVFYKSSVNYGMVCLLGIDGSTITPGTPFAVNSGTTYHTSIAKISATKVIVCYQNRANSSKGTACIIDIDGSTITPGTPVVFESGTTRFTSIAVLSESKVLVCYTDESNLYYGTACILDVDGSTITPGTPVVFEAGKTYDVSVAKLSESKVVVCYRDVDNSNYGTACILDIDGSTITAGTPVVFESGPPGWISLARLSGGTVVACYCDTDNSKNGTACALQEG